MKNEYIVESDLLYINDYKKNEEVKLWQTVIFKALEDLQLPLSNKRYRTWYKQSLKWFTSKDSDFLVVCDYASMSPVKILEIVNMILLKRKDA
jgi:hypothetical protein